jgi:hypothetical protein
MFRILVLLLLIPMANPAVSEVYRTTDKNGNVVFTDSPSPEDAANAEAVKVTPTNITASPQNIPALEAKPKPLKGVPLTVAITAPANDTIIPRGPGNFSVSAEAGTPLGENHRLQLFIDGAAHSEPQSGGQWELTNVYRGQHDLTVTIVDDSGESLATSSAVRVYVFRPSASFN